MITDENECKIAAQKYGIKIKDIHKNRGTEFPGGCHCTKMTENDQCDDIKFNYELEPSSDEIKQGAGICRMNGTNISNFILLEGRNIVVMLNSF